MIRFSSASARSLHLAATNPWMVEHVVDTAEWWEQHPGLAIGSHLQSLSQANWNVYQSRLSWPIMVESYGDSERVHHALRNRSMYNEMHSRCDTSYCMKHARFIRINSAL